jgi:hypothetical protein
MKSIWCTLIHQGLSNSIKNMAKGVVVWEISMGKTNKQNKQTIVLHK